MDCGGILTGILGTLALGILMLAVTALVVFSVIWVLNGGEAAAYKPASWVSRLIYWFGVFCMGSLMLSVAVIVAMSFARIAWGL